MASRRFTVKAALTIVAVAFLLSVTSGAWAQSPTPAPAPPAAAGEQKPAPKVVGKDLGLKGNFGVEIKKAPEGKGKGEIDPAAEPGVFGIPGAPKVGTVLSLIWAIWVGWIFSTVGAFGGIMAGVGHMTVYGLGDYANTFSKSAKGLNSAITDSLKASNQFLVGLSAVLSVINYLKAKRMSWPLGLALGSGALLGGWLVPYLITGKLSFKEYQGVFGVFVFIVGGVLFYETTPKGQASKKAAKAAAQEFEKSVKEKKLDSAGGIRVTSWSVAKIKMSFFGNEFSFSPIAAFFGGFIISAISALIGVGGGFLYVPYLTSIVGLPMFVVAGTSALAVFISMVSSLVSLFQQGVVVDWTLIGTQLAGVFIGSMVGPRTQKYIPDIWLKRLFIVLALYVGLAYVLRGFFHINFPPM